MVKVTEILFLQSESVIILLGSMEVSMHLALYHFFFIETQVQQLQVRYIFQSQKTP